MAILGREVLALERGLRPWNEMLEGESWCFWMVVVVDEKVGVNKVDEVAIVLSSGLKEWILDCNKSGKR